MTLEFRTRVTQGPVHSKVTVFVGPEGSGANCGTLTLQNDEAQEFVEQIWKYRFALEVVGAVREIRGRLVANLSAEHMGTIRTAGHAECTRCRERDLLDSIDAFDVV